jgi:hypothetical protein
VKSFTAHPHFDRANVLNDIGIVQLETAANFQHKNIKPICLPITNELQELPKNLIVIGWGKTEKSFRSPILQKASVPYFDQEKCRQKFTALQTRKKFVLIDGQFCAGGEGL